MGAFPASVVTLARRPSAFVPVLMSLTALTVVIGSIAAVGPLRQTDEGAAAHLFQLLIVGEVPLLAFFTLKWLRKDVRATLAVLALQGVAIAAALFPVWYFGL